jgi:hypothetical protein
MKKSMRKEAVLIVSLLFILTSYIALADTNEINTKKSGNISISSYQEDRSILAWDNGLDYESMASSQLHGSYDSILADDFIFNDPVEISRIKWIGGYWGEDYQNCDWHWSVSFFKSSYGGDCPSGDDVLWPSHIGPISLLKWELTRSLIKDTGNQIYYEMTCALDYPEPITFDAGKVYWACIFASKEDSREAGWGFHRTIKQTPAVGGSDTLGFPYWTPGIDILGYDFDMAFQLFEPSSEVCCDGNLNLGDVQSGSTVSDTFKVSNCGELDTLLDWEITEHPTWGSDWTFIPNSGIDLKPQDGWVTIGVSFVAPSKIKKQYIGTIKIQNEDNPNDYCEISVTVKTPKPKEYTKSQFLCMLFERFPNIFSILRNLLGL